MARGRATSTGQLSKSCLFASTNMLANILMARFFSRFLFTETELAVGNAVLNIW